MKYGLLADTERSPGHRAKPEAPDERSEGSAAFDVRGGGMKYGLLAETERSPGHRAKPEAPDERSEGSAAFDVRGGRMKYGLLASGAVVEMMMLPETGTVVMSAPSTAASTVPLGGAIPEAKTDSGTLAEQGPVPAAAASSSSEATQPAQPAKKKRGRRGKGRNQRTPGSAAPGFPRELRAVGTPAGASPIVIPAPPVALDADTAGIPDAAATDVHGAGTSGIPDAAVPGVHDAGAPSVPDAGVPNEDIEKTMEEPVATWAPKMPPLAAPPSVPWRKPAYAAPTAVAFSSLGPSLVPSLVIDDADPDSAERILEERAEKQAPRRSFLPPILLDREDRSARQGGLTLAVILLLIAATLTLSYLMRRPSAGGDGMTRLDAPSGHVDVLVVG
jgi:hypothetical protein